MVHKEVGFQVVERFLAEIAPFGHPDSPPKLVGRGLNVMMSPLPRNKRAKNPREGGDKSHFEDEQYEVSSDSDEQEGEVAEESPQEA